MNLTEQTKKFFLEYWNALSGKPKTETLIRLYVDDEKLIQHILFFESIFPEYTMVPKEIIAENDKLFVRAVIRAKHEGQVDGIPATMKKIDAPFAVGYQIRNNRIIDFWAIADQMDLLEQLGLSAEQVEVRPA
jgi:hypothetical protein